MGSKCLVKSPVKSLLSLMFHPSIDKLNNSEDLENCTVQFWHIPLLLFGKISEDQIFISIGISFFEDLCLHSAYTAPLIMNSSKIRRDRRIQKQIPKRGESYI